MIELLKDWWPYIAATVGALWAAFTYFDGKRRKAQEAAAAPPAAPPSIKADRGSTAVGVMSGGTINTSAATPKDGGPPPQA